MTALDRRRLIFRSASFRTGPVRRRARATLMLFGLVGWVARLSAQDTGAAATTPTTATASTVRAANARWTLTFQATGIDQAKAAFQAPYTGPNSLSPAAERSYSFTTTIFVGVRAWRGAELYFNPETIQSVPFSNLHGLGGLTNSEQQKTSGPRPTLYVARLFLRQTIGLGGGHTAIAAGANQLAKTVDARRLVVTVGKMSILDTFDNNAYAHDARTQFTNWTFLTYGAFDYAADARGYTNGVAVEYFQNTWALRCGRFMGPETSNGLALDHDIWAHHGDQVEIERGHTARGQPGKIRFLAFRNTEVMGRFADAIALATLNGGPPDVAQVRRLTHKSGLGLSLEQSLGSGIGFFGRASWADGQSETYSFTEIERSFSAGVVIQGARWRRSQDRLGIAVAQNGLGAVHREYLADGGLGAFIGDGQLTYGPERIIEAYYDVRVFRDIRFAVGGQRIDDPGYNSVRGPVSVGTVRLHLEF